MKFSIFGALVAVFLMSVGAQAATGCRAPYEPDIPARFETEEQLMEVYGAVKNYITKASPDYLECLDAAIARIDPKADDAAAQKAAIDQAHNENIDSQLAVKNRFDAAHNIWKEEHPGK